MSCAAPPHPSVAEIEREGVLTDAEAQRLFDETAQRYLNISGEEFLRMWDAQAFHGPEQQWRASRVAVLIPLVRNIRAGKKTV